ncbi:MAG: rRNA pseudouridine synthase [Caldilineaceae bacterium]|nr:rRNA pseudouridine synthase [Caldilineaceae bacterium]
MSEERLQKVMAGAGVASRRASEKMIEAGRVSVNGRVVTEMGVKVDLSKDKVMVDGKPLRTSDRHVYVKVHKPKGMLSDIGGRTDGRPTVADLLPPGVGRVFPVGRLDLNSEGLVLLTDDGELAHRLTHPRYEHPKTYFVLIDTFPGEEALNRLRNGVELETGRTAPAQVEVVDSPPAGLILDEGYRRGTWLRIVLREGKKRQIRHMIGAVDLFLHRLVRWSIGPLTLAQLPPSQSAHLAKGELASLRDMAESKRKTRGTGRSSRSAPRRR